MSKISAAEWRRMQKEAHQSLEKAERERMEKIKAQFPIDAAAKNWLAYPDADNHDPIIGSLDGCLLAVGASPKRLKYWRAKALKDGSISVHFNKGYEIEWNPQAADRWRQLGVVPW